MTIIIVHLRRNSAKKTAQLSVRTLHNIMIMMPTIPKKPLAGIIFLLQFYTHINIIHYYYNYNIKYILILR